MVTVSSLTLDRMSRELLSSWIKAKTSASSDSFSGICRTLRSSCNVDWRWISLWAALRGSVTLSPSGSAELASWEESGLITKHPGQEEPAVGYIRRGCEWQRDGQWQRGGKPRFLASSANNSLVTYGRSFLPLALSFSINKMKKLYTIHLLVNVSSVSSHSPGRGFGG